MYLTARKFLFVINHQSGKSRVDWNGEIISFSKELPPRSSEIYHLPKKFSPEDIKQKISDSKATCVVAVGGDGTVNVLAQAILNTPIVLAILPAGSANGMATELNISNDASKALNVLLTGQEKRISAIKLNEHISVHLSDIGLNAYLVKIFESQSGRGLIGYFRAAMKVLFKYEKFYATLFGTNIQKEVTASLIVIANSTKYGTGITINPVGTLDDQFFELVIIKKMSVFEVIKMNIGRARLNKTLTEIIQSKEIQISVKQPVHFQIDGEYIGKVSSITASIIPNCISVLVPFDTLSQ